ncbi:MAG: shikimate dehydrogenase [Armatimonadota bacterium]|nr:MAG: shikimate dehydrogenase [Armatimonadota bacterium]
MGHFGFIIHPLSVKEDMARKYAVARYLPTRLLEWGLKRMSPMMVSHITGVAGCDGARAEGVFVGCPLGPRQMLELDPAYVIGRIIEAGKLAQDAGARIVGLGAFTSVVGDAGVSIARGLDIAVTTGNSYTVHTAIEGALEAARLMGLDPARSAAAVVGCTGSIGRVISQMLAAVVPHLILIGRDEQRLREVAEQTRGPAQVATSTNTADSLHAADIVVTVTSAVDTVIEPEFLRPGAVVCDVARPRDVSRRVADQRPDVLVIEGGVVAVPGEVDFGFDFGFPPRTAYACMSETIILALEQRYESYSLGRDLSAAKVTEIAQLATKHGFRLAGFRSFEREVTSEHIERTRELAERARNRGIPGG